MKVQELTGGLLDYWVAKAQGDREIRLNDGRCEARFHPNFEFSPYSPSAAWMHGGPIIERERINILKFDHPEQPWVAVIHNVDEHWIDTTWFDEDWKGQTPLIAAMRAYVASKFGDEVPTVGLTP